MATHRPHVEISINGEKGVGKSTVAAFVEHALKKCGYSVDVHEMDPNNPAKHATNALQDHLRQYRKDIGEPHPLIGHGRSVDVIVGGEPQPYRDDLLDRVLLALRLPSTLSWEQLFPELESLRLELEKTLPVRKSRWEELLSLLEIPGAMAWSQVVGEVAKLKSWPSSEIIKEANKDGLGYAIDQLEALVKQGGLNQTEILVLIDSFKAKEF